MGCGLVALMSWSVPATIGWWLAGALISVAVLVCRSPDETPVRWKPVLRRSLTWPTMVLAAGGLLLTLEPETALLVSVAALAAAWEAGWFGGGARGDLPAGVGHRGGRRWWGSRAGDRAAPATDISPLVAGPVDVDPVDALSVTDALTDADLCRAWRSSYVALDRAADPSEKLRAVEIREVILDELGRRDASGLEAWFRSGARAAGWPDRYLRGVEPRQSRDAH
ncbi:hypothetical protein UG56_006430 [Nocardioides luteus]|uniref:Uncharacterized protein n=1 Tax=Nocardioides luteus TaxID=1844 RepID=A0A1J4N824_9ACTN|nr:hypothetical protein UG56_006430 [Nocardioides luteus]